MIKTEITQPSPERTGPTFPLLARYKEQPGVDYVVMFKTVDSGTVVASNSSSTYPVGDYSERWAPCTESCWEILPRGTKVTLEVT